MKQNKTTFTNCSHKLPYAYMRSIMAKLDNELAKEKESNKVTKTKKTE